MSENGPRYVIGVDVGGTFTDVFFLNEVSGHCEVTKVPSTPADQSKGFIEGIRQKIANFADVSTVVHGTTVGTNALLERNGSRTGIITTQGFRDVLEMRRRDRPNTWGLWGQYEPVVPRNRRVEVAERTLADGTIRTTVDAGEVKRAAHRLLELGCQSACIVFINAYANSANERTALKILREIWPNSHVGASSDILPEIREFERTSTTTLNAYLQPVVASYLHKLEQALHDDGFEGEVLIVQSNGGVMSVDTARQLPVRTTLSGPAAGVIASGFIASEAGFPNVITCDMGGTSFDVSLVVNGQSSLAAQTSIDFGLTVRTPMIEMTTIGAGGGSIASVDPGGLLQVGPLSAGSDPGPVCYGLGNERPTVTDANVVLGRINADKPIGGKLGRLDVEAAKTAIDTHVATPLGLDVMRAAEAVIRVANSKMAGAIRLVSIERGYDPKNFSAMPFGGGGALHAGALIKEVGLKSALVPRYPGINSALGCTIADMRHDFVQTVNGILGQLDISGLDKQLSGLAVNGLQLLENTGVEFESSEVRFELDMSYLGQTHTVDVTVPLDFDGTSTGISTDIISSVFEIRYREVYGKPLSGIPVRVLNLRVSAIGRRPKFDLTMLAPADGVALEDACTGTRQVWFDNAFHKTGIYQRLPLSVGTHIPGPAILEQPDATICIEPELEGRVDRFGNLIITRNQKGLSHA
ncbi:MAG: hydantoinase/oxoprolinase family protein [Hyphomicrobiales bacterium]|nr:hydantoinase/oxoprolinase family protein [Hyphomicrobiales bacterium]